MSYNGIGRATPRGTGTNGYVQRNFSYVNTNVKKTEYEYKQEAKAALERQSLSQSDYAKKSNKEIIEHGNKRKVEVILHDWATETGLYDRDLPEEEREEILSKKRQEIALEMPSKSEEVVNDRPTAENTHEKRDSKSREIEKFQSAMNKLPKDFVPGTSLDSKLNKQRKEKRKEEYELKKKERERREKEAKRSEKDRKSSSKRKSSSRKSSKYSSDESDSDSSDESDSDREYHKKRSSKRSSKSSSSKRSKRYSSSDESDSDSDSDRGRGKRGRSRERSPKPKIEEPVQIKQESSNNNNNRNGKKSDTDLGIYSLLVYCRQKLAAPLKIQAERIMSNRSLERLVDLKPTSLKDLNLKEFPDEEITYIEKYGEGFIQVIQDYLKEKETTDEEEARPVSKTATGKQQRDHSESPVRVKREPSESPVRGGGRSPHKEVGADQRVKKEDSDHSMSPVRGSAKRSLSNGSSPSRSPKRLRASSRDRMPPKYRDRTPPRHRDRSRDRTPPRYRDRSRDRTPPRYRDRSRDRTPPRYRDRSRDRTPSKYRRSSRSPPRYRDRSRDRTPPRYRDRSRDRTPPRYRDRSPRRDSPR